MEEMDVVTNATRKTCIQQQVDEVEMLQSIFCNAGEMKIADHSILADMFEFLEDKRDHLDQKLEYTISVPILNASHTLELQFELAHTYPLIEQPCITVRTTLPSPNKSAIETELKRQINAYIGSNEVDKSSVYVYPIVVWLQDHFEQIFQRIAGKTTTDHRFTSLNCTLHTEAVAEPNIEMERLWIYSHHLKSTQKRQDILKYAKELDLTGFSKPGKPGIICVEGRRENAQEFWKYIRQWPWQRITIRLSETKSKPLSKSEKFRRFAQFKETMCGAVDGDADAMDSVMPINMSEFMKFLDGHNCGYVKKELFLME